MRKVRDRRRDEFSSLHSPRRSARPTSLGADRPNLIADLRADLHQRAVSPAIAFEPVPASISSAPLSDAGDERASTTATGFCRGHWGEYLQGGWERDGWVSTIAVPVGHTGYARVRCSLRPGEGNVFADGNRPKLRNVARALLLVADRLDVDVHLRVETNIPMGIGGGSSTAEACAAVRALMAGLNIQLNDLEIARVCFIGEGPTDALPLQSLGRPVLWLSRRGELYDVLRHPLPLLACVGAVGGMHKISTEAQARSTFYERSETREFARILRRAQRALARRSPRDFIRFCEESLELNQRRCVTPRLAELREIGAEVGALGVIGSHSGTAAAIVFDRRSEGYAARSQAALQEVCNRGFLFTHEFLTP